MSSTSLGNMNLMLNLWAVLYRLSTVGRPFSNGTGRSTDTTSTLLGPLLIHPDGPLGDIDVVCAPIGELAAGVFIPPAEFVMRAAGGIPRIRGTSAALNVIDQWRLTLPHVPIQFGRHIDFGKRLARIAFPD